MPVSWRISEGTVRLASDGRVTFEAWRAALDAFSRHPDYRPGMGVIHDWRNRREPMETAEAWARSNYILQLAATFAPTRWAVVVETRADSGARRMRRVLLPAAAIVQFGVFRDASEAEAWVRGAPGRRDRPR